MPFSLITKKLKSESKSIKQKVQQLKAPQQIVQNSEDEYNRCKSNLVHVKKETSEQIEKLEKLEVKIFKSFQRFSNAFEQLKNRPEFEQKANESFTLPKLTFYDFQKFKTFQIEIHQYFIAILVIPFIGQFLAMGSIFKELKNNSNLEKALEIKREVNEINRSIRKSIDFLIRLDVLATKMEIHLNMIHKIYRKQVYEFETLVARNTDYASYTQEEKMLVDTNIKLVAILYKLINQELTQQEEQSNDVPVLLDDQTNNLILQSEQAVTTLHLVH